MTTTLPAGQVNDTYNTTLTANGGVKPYTWTVYSGSLPVGLTLGSSGSLSGIPTTQGQFTFTVQVADSEIPQATARQQLMLTINPAAPPLNFQTELLAEGVVNTAYGATLQASGGIGPYTYTLTQGGLPQGLTLTSAGAISGTPTQTGTSTFTILAADAESPPQTASAQFSITVVATPLTITTTTLPDAVVNIPYTAQLQATGGSPPYTWQEQTLGQGFSLLANGVVTTSPGWPTKAQTITFTAQVMDSAQQVSRQLLSITVDLGSNALLNGNYAFQASGFGPGGTSQWAAAGSLVADGNGNITSGELDSNSTASSPQNSAVTGTYSIAPNGLGTMTLNSATSTVMFAFALSSTFNSYFAQTIATGQIIEFDDSNGKGSRAAGVITPQANVSLNFAGTYVFGYSGQDVANSGRVAEVGEFTLGGNGAITNGIADSNDAGTMNSLTFSGNLTAIDSAGRGMAALTVTVNGMPHVEHYALYVGARNFGIFENAQFYGLYAVSIDPLNGSGQLLSGSTLLQVTRFGFGLDGTSLLQAAGLDVSAGQPSGVAAAGLATFDGAGNITKVDVEQNVGGAFTFYNGLGTYQMASNGRVTLAAPGLPSIGYLAGANQMFAISSDASATLAYFQSQSQSGAPFSNASFSGYYAAGSLPPVEPNATNSVLQLTADGSGNLTGVGDNSGPNGLQSNVNIASTYSLDATGKSPLSGAISGYLYLGGLDQLATQECIVVTGESNPRLLTILQY